MVIYAAGSGIAFLLNAASFFGVIYFLYRWKCAPGTHLRVVEVTCSKPCSTAFATVAAPTACIAVIVRSAVFSISLERASGIVAA